MLIFPVDRVGARRAPERGRRGSPSTRARRRRRPDRRPGRLERAVDRASHGDRCARGQRSSSALTFGPADARRTRRRRRRASARSRLASGSRVPTTLRERASICVTVPSPLFSTQTPPNPAPTEVGWCPTRTRATSGRRRGRSRRRCRPSGAARRRARAVRRSAKKSAAIVGRHDEQRPRPRAGPSAARASASVEHGPSLRRSVSVDGTGSGDCAASCARDPRRRPRRGARRPRRRRPRRRHRPTTETSHRSSTRSARPAIASAASPRSR